MSSKIETKNSSSETQLLDELRSTVITRWDEFDNALPIGASFKSEYQSMKSAYDWLIADISPIKTDAELKQNQAVKTKLDTFLKQLSDYLKREDRRKDLDGTLVETNTQIAKLRDGIYIQRTVQAESGKLQQEVATNKPASTPDKKPETLPTTAQAAATAAVGGTGAVAAIESGGKKAEEAVKGIMKPLEKIKKWSSDIGDAWDAGWELVKKGDISKGIWLFFAVLFGGNLKDALAKYTGKGEEKSTDKKEEAKKENTEQHNRYYASLWVFQSVNKAVLERYTGNVRSRWDDILRSEKFMNLDFNIVWSLMQKDFQKGAIVTASHLHRYVDANILKPLWYESNQKNYESVQYALLSIFYKNDQNFIGKHIGSEFARFQKENKNATIRQVIEGLSDEIDMASRFDFSGEGETDFLTINPNTNAIEWSGWRVLSSAFSKETLTTFAKNSTIRVPMSFDQKAFEVNTSFAWANMEEVKKLIDFRSKIQENICTNQQFLFGRGKYEQPLRKWFEQMTYYDVMKLYAMMGGKTDVGSFGAMRSALVYTQISSLLEHDNIIHGAYLSDITRETSTSVWGSSKYMPEWTVAFLSAIFGNIGKSVWDWMTDIAEKWWGGMKTNPWTTISATVVGGIFFLYTRFFPAKGQSIMGKLTGK